MITARSKALSHTPDQHSCSAVDSGLASVRLQARAISVKSLASGPYSSASAAARSAAGRSVNENPEESELCPAQQTGRSCTRSAYTAAGHASHCGRTADSPASYAG